VLNLTIHTFLKTKKRELKKKNAKTSLGWLIGLSWLKLDVAGLSWSSSSAGFSWVYQLRPTWSAKKSV